MGATASLIGNVGSGLQILGGIAGAKEERKAGEAAKAKAIYDATQDRIAAGQAQAAAQRDAFEINRQTELNASRALAVAASSGGGASDPTVINMIARNASEGAYRKAVALYQGEDKARLLNMQADAAEYEGTIAERQGKARSKAMLLNTVTQGATSYARGTSMKSKYG